MNFKNFKENKDREEKLRTWLSTSKVQNPVYHGTPYPGFQVFSKSPDKRNTANETSGLGLWFTDSKEVASNFATATNPITTYKTTGERWEDGELKKFAHHDYPVGGVMPVYLKISNPKVYGESDADGFEEMMDDRDEFSEYINGAKGEKGYWRKRYIAENPKETNKQFVEYLQSLRYDGIIMKNSIYDSTDKNKNTHYVVFSPTQIKSVFSKGFDPNKDEFGESVISEAAVKDIHYAIERSIIEIVGRGDWEIIDKRNLMPTFKMQAYGVIELKGTNVRMRGDKFYVKVFHEIKKSQEEMQYPKGYLKDYEVSSPEDKAEKEKEKNYTKITEYDPKLGHDRIRFRGFIEGWQPGMMPGAELDLYASAQLKGYDNLGGLGGETGWKKDMMRIGEFENEQTPYNVAIEVKMAIDNFNGGGGRGKDDTEPEPGPKPSYKVKV